MIPNCADGWMVSGPEISRITCEYKKFDTESVEGKHHEQIASVQKAFQQHVVKLVAAIEDFGSPFQEDGDDLYNLDTKVVIDEIGVQAIRNALDSGQRQLEKFMQQQLCGTDAFYDTLKKNKLLFFKAGTKSSKSNKAKQKEAAAIAKNDLELFSQLYISCQSRGSNLDNFF